MEDAECTFMDLLVQCAEDQARMRERARLFAESRVLAESSDDDGEDESESVSEDEVKGQCEDDSESESGSGSGSDNDEESHSESGGADENSSNHNEGAANRPRIAADWQPVPTVVSLRHILRRAQLPPPPRQQTNPPWSSLSVQERQALYVPGPVPDRPTLAPRYIPRWSSPLPPATTRKVFRPCFGASCPVGCTLDRHDEIEREEEGKRRCERMGQSATNVLEDGSARDIQVVVS